MRGPARAELLLDQRGEFFTGQLKRTSQQALAYAISAGCGVLSMGLHACRVHAFRVLCYMPLESCQGRAHRPFCSLRALHKPPASFMHVPPHCSALTVPSLQDSTYKYFEVILVDPAHAAIRNVRSSGKCSSMPAATGAGGMGAGGCYAMGAACSSGHMLMAGLPASRNPTEHQPLHTTVSHHVCQQPRVTSHLRPWSAAQHAPPHPP